MKRRILLKGTAASASLVAAAVAGLLVPVRLLAADWPQTAFESDDAGNAIKDYFGDAAVVDSDQVVIKAPLQAENGAVVPIKVTTTLANVESIAIDNHLGRAHSGVVDRTHDESVCADRPQCQEIPFRYSERTLMT